MWLAPLLLAVVALLLGACESGSEASGNVSVGPARGEASRVVAENNAFSPDVLELPAGEEVTVEFTNDDSVPHDFTIESMGLSTGVIQAGEVATATFTVPDSETEFVCTIHPDMKGVIEPR